MQRQKTIALMVALVMSSTATAYALNVGIIRATSTSSAAAAAPAGEDVTTIVVDVPYDTGPTAVAGNAIEAAPPAAVVAQPAPAAAPAPAATPAPTAAPTPAPTAAPAPAPTAAPSTSATPTTSYDTFAAGPAGSVVIASTGDSMEFWAAYTENGWQYQVEKASGSKIVVKYRLGDSEMAFIAKNEGGSIVTQIEGPSGGDDGDDGEEDDD